MARHNSRIRFELEVNQIRREMLQGRDHLVAPVIAIQEMVLPNTNELLPAEEIESSVLFWEGVAVAIDHPMRNGEFASANEKKALEEQVVGRLFEMFFHAPSRQLRGEMWIDLELADRVDRGTEAVERIEAAERTRDIVEVSTSYFAKVEDKSGTHEGQPFQGIQREIRPDHLAILLDMQGACSVSDGCGAPRSQRANKIDEELDVRAGDRGKKIDDDLVANPFPNEHACRVRPVSDFQAGSFRRISRMADGKTLDIIIGRPKGQTTTAAQAFRYPKDEWTVAQARAHCRRNDGILFEPATGKSNVKANVRSSARRPTVRGTEETPWSSPTITQWIDGFVSVTGGTRPDTNRVADLPSAVRTWIANRTLLGEASADNERDLTFFPVVRPGTNKLNAGALRAVLGGRGAQARIPEAAKTSAQNMARRLLEANFGDRSQTGGSTVNKGLLHKALEMLGRAIGGGETMDRKKTVEALAANKACPFDCERLEEFSDEELTGLAATYAENTDGKGSGEDGGDGDGDGDGKGKGKGDAEGKSSAHADGKGKGEAAADTALSEEDREGLKALREIGPERLKELAASETDRRKVLVDKLEANKACSIEKKDLEKMPLTALDKLDRMLVPADYSGAGGPFRTASSGADDAIPKAPAVILATPVADKDSGKK